MARGQDMWSIEQVVALAARSARFAAGEAIAVPSAWSRTGSSARALWGRYDGAAAEPYAVVVDHVEVAHRCTCPSRVHPCKHVIGLLVLWVRGHIPIAPEPEAVGTWVNRGHGGASARHSPGAPAAGGAGAGRDADAGTTGSAPDVPGDEPVAPAGSPPDAERTRQRDERVARLLAGLVELDRWLEDRVRTGLADASVARFGTWDDLAARLTDARAGALANRVRRLAGRVGASEDWHAEVLAELGVLHLLAQAGQRVPSLPAALADTVAVACGWQVRSADVAASAPETDTWLVAGRSDTREDLIEVRRVWLRGVGSARWALVLSFAAFGQSLDSSLVPGDLVTADVHRYPGGASRVLVGERSGEVEVGTGAAGDLALDVAGVCEVVGRALATEPWLERAPFVVRATPTVADQRWVITDGTGSLPLAGATRTGEDALAVLVAASAGRAVTLAAEWTPDGVVPLTLFLADRALDIGPRADASFVSAA